MYNGVFSYANSISDVPACLARMARADMSPTKVKCGKWVSTTGCQSFEPLFHGGRL
jgi:hypothetical protein